MWSVLRADNIDAFPGPKCTYWQSTRPRNMCTSGQCARLSTYKVQGRCGNHLKMMILQNIRSEGGVRGKEDDLKAKRRRRTQSEVSFDRRRFPSNATKSSNLGQSFFFKALFCSVKIDQGKMSLSKCCNKLGWACFCDMPKLGRAERVEPRAETETN